eukprot:1160755-Pelagomonas_calceolata.AAC.8
MDGSTRKTEHDQAGRLPLILEDKNTKMALHLCGKRVSWHLVLAVNLTRVLEIFGHLVNWRRMLVGEHHSQTHILNCCKG